MFEAVERLERLDDRSASLRSQKPNPVLHLPRVHSSCSGVLTEPSVYGDDGAELVEASIYLTDDQHELPYLLGVICINPATSLPELRSLIEQMLAQTMTQGNHANTHGALFLRDPATRTWKPLAYVPFVV